MFSQKKRKMKCYTRTSFFGKTKTKSTSSIKNMFFAKQSKAKQSKAAAISGGPLRVALRCTGIMLYMMFFLIQGEVGIQFSKVTVLNFPTKLRFLSEFRTLRHWIVYCLPPINFNYNNCFWVFWCFFLRAWITCVNYVSCVDFLENLVLFVFLIFFWFFYISLQHYCRKKKTSLRHGDISMFFFRV